MFRSGSVEYRLLQASVTPPQSSSRVATLRKVLRMTLLITTLRGGSIQTKVSARGQSTWAGPVARVIAVCDPTGSGSELTHLALENRVRSGAPSVPVEYRVQLQVGHVQPCGEISSKSRLARPAGSDHDDSMHREIFPLLSPGRTGGVGVLAIP